MEVCIKAEFLVDTFREISVVGVKLDRLVSVFLRQRDRRE